MALLVLLLFLLYNSNFRQIGSGDTIPARLLPFSLLLDGSLYLDEWVQPYLQGELRHGTYFLTKAHGHWMSNYPIILPLLISPLYVAPAWWLSQQPTREPGTIILLAETMEKLSAALIAALSAGVLYLALRKVASSEVSLLITLVYGIASSTWSISSQALWRQGLAELSFSFLLWSLLGNPSTRSYTFRVGLALAVAAANKPAYILVGLPFLVYFARQQRKRLLPFCAPFFVLGSLVLAYNLYFFGRLLGAYGNPVHFGGSSGTADLYRISQWDGLAGLLVSPSRGLFIFIPWALFAFWGMVRVWKENAWGWGRYLLLGLAPAYFLQARFGVWWGGWCYGPRYLTDLLPFFAFFLIPVWPRIRAAPLLRGTFVLTLALALWVQLVGVCYYPRGAWDSSPQSVDERPERLWDWSDTQLARTWYAGPATPTLYYRWREYLALRRIPKQRKSRSRPQQSPTRE